MKEVSPEELRKGVERMHGCSARVSDAVSVTEEFEGETAWRGVAHIFDLEGHPTATRAYAWSSPIEGSDKRRFYAVLHVPPVESASDAVWAVIMHDFRHKNRK